MYSLTVPEIAVLGLILGTMATVVVLGALYVLPRARTAVTTRVVCPVVHRRAVATIARDEWTRRLDVTWCSVLGSPSAPACRRTCLVRTMHSPASAAAARAA